MFPNVTLSRRPKQSERSERRFGRSDWSVLLDVNLGNDDFQSIRNVTILYFIYSTKFIEVA
jgi:hypothetical protein